jgi:hypothetical protein
VPRHRRRATPEKERTMKLFVMVEPPEQAGAFVNEIRNASRG